MKSRRVFLKKAASIGAVGLLGCGGDDGGSDAGTMDAARSDAGADATSPDGTALDATAVDAIDAAVVDDRWSPVLFNFHITNAEPTRVYFDSSKPITGSSIAGFVISGTTIDSLTVNGALTTGHYFTVSSPFTFWDNNTIRYEGEGDVIDGGGRALFEFTLTYIVNQIDEPISSGTPYYVRTSGNDSNDGLSHGAAFATVSRAAAIGATVVYVEVGTYRGEQVEFRYGGTPTNPLLIQGYKTLTAGVPDPIEPNYWVYGEHGTFDDKTVDDTELPTFVGTDRNSASVAWRLKGNTILRNIQVYNYNTGLTCGGASNTLVDNFVAVEIGGFGPSGPQKAVYFVNSSRVRLKNILMSEGPGAFVRTWGGDHNLLDNVTYVGDQNHPDYQISLYAGSNNIVRNSLVHIVAGPAQHGFGVKASGVASEHNLFDGNTSLCTGDGNNGVEWRHSGTRFTVVKNHVFDGGTQAIQASNGTSNNIAENCIIRNMQHQVISFVEGPEDDSSVQSGGDNNLFRNLVIYNSRQLVAHSSSVASTTEATGNTFVNLTVHNLERGFTLPIQLNASNEFINCSFSRIAQYASNNNIPAATFTNCNWFNEFPAPAGTNTTTHDPDFVDAGSGDFHLGPASLLRDIGADSNLARYDAEGVERPEGAHSIGAHEG